MTSKTFPLVMWFTGMPCSGKTTLGHMLNVHLRAHGTRVTHIDGDDIRKTLCSDLGFTPDARRENLRRVAHLCNVLLEQSTVVIATFVSPNEADRLMVRNIVGDKHFLEVYIQCSSYTCQNRDVKGMYAEARAGHRQLFTGVSAEYEPPTAPEVSINTNLTTAEMSLAELLTDLTALSIL